MALFGLPGNGFVFLLFSMYLTATSFTYLLQHYNGKRKKENCFIFLCCFLTLVLSTFYFVFEFLRDGKDYSINSKFLCVLIPLVFKACITVSKVFSSLIFVYRYELINQRKLLAAPKRSKIVPAVFVLFSIVQFLGHVIFVTIIQSTSKLDKCNYEKLFITNSVSYSYFTAGCFILKTILQTIILVETIKPIYKHCVKSTVASSFNNKLRNTLYRVFCCSLILTTADIAMIVVYYTTVVNNIIQGPLLFITYLYVVVLSLVCSYKDCGKRLFPFMSIFKNKLNKKSIHINRSETQKNSTEIQLKCALESSLHVLDESEVSSAFDSSIQISNESQQNCAVESSIHVSDDSQVSFGLLESYLQTLNENQLNSSSDSSTEMKNTKV